MATMVPTGTLPAGHPRVRANRPPEPAKGKPAPSAKIPREADGQSPERKRKIPPSTNPPEKNKKKKKKEKTTSPSAETKKTPPPLEHTWTPGDEIRILEAMAAHRQDEQGKLPKSSELFASIDGRLDNKGFSLKELRRKVRSLKGRHDGGAIKGGVPAEEHERRLYHLSKNVWGTIVPEPVTTSGLGEPAATIPELVTTSGLGGPAVTIPEPAATSDGGDASTMVPNVCETFDEMRERYPCLAQEVVHIVDEPAVLEKLLLGIDCSKASALNSKINGLREELTQAIMESAKMQSIQVPKGWQCPCNKLPPAKSKATNQSLLYLNCLDKIQGLSERMDHELVKLKQEIMASQKAESAESAPQSVVGEKQYSHNVSQRKIPVQEKVGHGNDKEVTSKYRPPQNLPQKVIFVRKRMHRVRKERMFAESQILHEADQRKVAGHAQQGLSHDRNVEGGKQVILHSCVRPHKPVAKAILQTCSPSTIVGGKALGPGCCEVLVNEVLDRKAPLIRPFGTMNTMADTLGFSIAWIRENIRHDTTAGMVAPNQPSPGQR